MKTPHEVNLSAPLPPLSPEAEARIAGYQEEQLRQQEEQLHQRHELQQHVADKHSEKALMNAERGGDATDVAHIIFSYYKRQPMEALEPTITEGRQAVESMVAAYSNRLKHNEKPGDEYATQRRAMFGRFGLEEEQISDIAKSWGAASNRRKMNPHTAKGREELDKYLGNIRQNLTSMVYLEAKYPGSVKGLFEKYGIRHFSRYYHEDLIDQHRGIHTGPVEVCDSAADDHNFAFSSRGVSYGGESSHARGLGIKKPLFIEARDPLEALSRLGTIREEFGEIKKIVFTAHGLKNLINFGLGALTEEQVRRDKSFQKLIEEGVLVPDADIILSACYGQKLAKAISEQVKGKAVAPGRKTGGVHRDPQTGEYLHIPIKSRNESVQIFEQGQRTNVGRLRRLGRRALSAVTSRASSRQ